MVGRLMGPLIFVAWAASMSWLVAHDLWPAWTARKAPNVNLFVLVDRYDGPIQAGIFDIEGRRIGGIWTEYSGDSELITRSDLLYLGHLPIVGEVLLVVDSNYDSEGALKSFTLDVHGADVPIHVEGERFHGQFAVAIRVGALETAFDLDSSLTGMIGDVFRPFSSLPNLTVGQTWRMQVFNPLAVIFRSGEPFTPLLVRVTEKTVLPGKDGPTECFVVKAEGVTAWVKPDGTILEQEATVPFFTRVTIREESYDDDLRREARRLLPTRQLLRSPETPGSGP